MAHQLSGADDVTVTVLERMAVPLLTRVGPGLWAWARETLGRRPPPVDFMRSISIRLRDEMAITLDLSAVPSVAVWFEVVNHSDVEVVLDRVVLEVRLGQPLLSGIMGHRHLIPRHETVSSIYFQGMLTEAAAALVRKGQEALRAGTNPSQQLTVYARAYFDSPTLRFAIDSKNLMRSLPSS